MVGNGNLIQLFVINLISFDRDPSKKIQNKNNLSRILKKKVDVCGDPSRLSLPPDFDFDTETIRF